MNVYVVGVAVHPARSIINDLRLEEIAFNTSHAALENAGVSRQDLDHVTLAACDEFDGRSITSMLMAAPSGAYLKDETRVTDSGLSGLCLESLRIASGRFHLGLIIGWNQTSIGPLDDMSRMCAEPFTLRPIGMNKAIADGLFAGAVSEYFKVSEDDLAEIVIKRQRSAAHNPRAVSRMRAEKSELLNSDYIAFPVRSGYCAPVTDGAVALVVASQQWVEAHPASPPLARIASAGWAIDSYRLDQERLTSFLSLHNAMNQALGRAGLSSANELQLVELEASNSYYDIAFTRALGLDSSVAVSPSGGTWAQNPQFCTGLVNAAEAIWQVSSQAGPHQVKGARLAGAHSAYGYAQQGNAVVIFERV